MIDEGRQIWGRCPECNGPMEILTDAETRKRFLRCRRFPRCETRRELPIEVEMIEAGAVRLPGMD